MSSHHALLYTEDLPGRPPVPGPLPRGTLRRGAWGRFRLLSHYQPDISRLMLSIIYDEGCNHTGRRFCTFRIFQNRLLTTSASFRTRTYSFRPPPKKVRYILGSKVARSGPDACETLRADDMGCATRTPPSLMSRPRLRHHWALITSRAGWTRGSVRARWPPSQPTPGLLSAALPSAGRGARCAVSQAHQLARRGSAWDGIHHLQKGGLLHCAMSWAFTGSPEACLISALPSSLRNFLLYVQASLTHTVIQSFELRPLTTTGQRGGCLLLVRSNQLESPHFIYWTSWLPIPSFSSSKISLYSVYPTQLKRFSLLTILCHPDHQSTGLRAG